MYNNYGFNPYFQQQRFQNVEQPIQQPIVNYQQPIQMPKSNGLLGKSVDSIDVVKAMDIPLDGSISYFPLTDGSAIVSKQLQTDGTSKTIVYKPIVEKQKDKQQERFVTFEEFDRAIGEIDLSELEELQNLKEDIREIKKQLKDFKIKKGKEN